MIPLQLDQYQEPAGAGFYRADDAYLYHAPNFVRGPGYDLFAEQRETYTYPIHGWTWFDDEVTARAALGLPAIPELPVEE